MKVITAIPGLHIFEILKSVQRSNQFDQLSELRQHEKSRRGIWSSVLTCGHLPQAVDQGIRPR